MLRQLAALRRRFLPYFTEGQFRFREGLSVDGGEARLYTHDDHILVIVTNPSDVTAHVTISVGPTVWGASPARGTILEIDLDGNEIDRTTTGSSAFQRTAHLDVDSLRIFEFRAEV